KVPQWPTRAGAPGTTSELERPVLKVWWNPDQETRPADRVDRGHDFEALSDLNGRKLAVGGDIGRVERGGVGGHSLAVAGGGGGGRPPGGVMPGGAAGTCTGPAGVGTAARSEPAESGTPLLPGHWPHDSAVLADQAG